MSTLLVVQAPHYVKEAKLGHSLFLGQQHGQSLVFRYGKMLNVHFGFCLAFCLLIMALLLQ